MSAAQAAAAAAAATSGQAASEHSDVRGAPAPAASQSVSPGAGFFRSTMSTVTLSLLPRSMAAFVRTLAAMRTAALREAPFSLARSMQRTVRLVASCRAGAGQGTEGGRAPQVRQDSSGGNLKPCQVGPTMSHLCGR